MLQKKSKRIIYYETNNNSHGRNKMNQQIHEYIRAHKQEIIEDWKELVNTEGSLREPENMYIVADLVQKKFAAAGVDCKVIGVDPSIPPVVAGAIGADRPGTPVIFSGHFDTVFNKGTYGENPFRIDEDGTAHGPGVLDMKGGIVIALWTIKALESIGFNERPIRICFCGDEEGGTHHEHAAKLIYEYTDGCIAGFNMETGPVNGDLCVGRKYAMQASFKVHGVSAHSGNNYEVGRNALVEAAHKIIAIQALNDMEKGTHMNPAVCHGGKMHNSIPDYVEVTVSGRFKYLEEAARVQKALKELYETPTIEGTSIEYSISDPMGGFEATEKNYALQRFVNEVCTKEGHPAVGAIFLGGGSDAASMAQTGVPVLCSCGVRGEWNHTDREYAVVESMYERAEMWSSVVLHIGEFKL